MDPLAKIKAAEQELPTLMGHRFVQQPDALRQHDFSEMNQKLGEFLDKLAQAYGK